MRRLLSLRQYIMDNSCSCTLCMRIGRRTSQLTLTGHPDEPSQMALAMLANAQSMCRTLATEYASLHAGKSTLDELYMRNNHLPCFCSRALRVTLDVSRTIVCELINESRPLNRLPPEILCHIFSLVPDDIIWHYEYVKVQPTFTQNITHYFIPDPDGAVVCPALKAVIVDCTDTACVDGREYPEADKPRPFSHKSEELATTRGPAGYPIDHFIPGIRDRGPWRISKRPSRQHAVLHEHDGEAILLRINCENCLPG
ncbi:hypothetical protein GY45DRAFT_1095423 [Cubamyces sp. BRFM 1775]|nr:hypothetical protein GY45DRAFT_1095423 [Cubamyces sp. BRFM 1775]